MLPNEIDALVSLSAAQPDNEGLFEALLALLENASDSEIVIEALDQLDAGDFEAHVDARARALALLEAAERPELAAAWGKLSEKVEIEALQKAPDNVISLSNGTSEPEVALLDIERDPAGVTMDDITGLKTLKSQIHRKIIRPFEKPGLYKRFNRRAGGGILMYGPPGCGKTMIAKAVAHECDARFLSVKAEEILDRFVGEAEKRIVKVFEKARLSRPSVLLFDEFEALGRRRNYNGAHSESTLISTLLQEMDGSDSDNEGLLFLAATNVPWSIDPAFKRPGRFDKTLFVPPPDRIARKFLLRKLLKNRPVSQDMEFDQIVERTSGFSGADLVSLIEVAIDYAIDETVDIDNIVPISTNHLHSALDDIRSSIGEWLGMAKGYVEYANQDGQYNDLKRFLKKYG